MYVISLTEKLIYAVYKKKRDISIVLWLRTVFQYFVLKDYTVKEVGKTNFNLFPLFCENDKKHTLNQINVPFLPT